MIFRRKGKSGEVKRHKPKCSFCGKMHGELGVRLVAGSGVFICSECISVANEMLWGHNPPGTGFVLMDTGRTTAMRDQ